MDIFIDFLVKPFIFGIMFALGIFFIIAIMDKFFKYGRPND